jgi:hypothetical protein
MAITPRGVLVSGSTIAALSTLYALTGGTTIASIDRTVILVVVGSWMVANKKLTSEFRQLPDGSSSARKGNAGSRRVFLQHQPWARVALRVRLLPP